MATRKLSDMVAVSFPFTQTDIGGTNTAGSSDAVHWVSMANFQSFMAVVELGTWDAADDLDGCKLEQATSSAGANKKDLTTSGSGATYDYNTAAPIDADGDQVILECNASDLDVDNGFKWVRVYANEADNTGVDNISAVYIRSNPRDAYNNVNAAAVAASIVYVNAGTL